MAVVYSTAIKNLRMLASRDDVANGTLEIGTSGMGTVLVTFGLDSAGGTVTDDVWTLIYDASPVAATADGTAAEAQIKDSVSTVQISGLTVGTSAADIILDSVSITVSQDVDLTSSTITHAT